MQPGGVWQTDRGATVEQKASFHHEVFKKKGHTQTEK